MSTSKGERGAEQPDRAGVNAELARPSSEALDRILGVQLKVLDDGFVRVIDYMGTEASVVQAARVSYGDGTRQLREDVGLIRFLMRHDHTTPFEMCELKLHVRAPMDAWRQWIRHRTANVNEYSTRYSIAIKSAQRTAPDGWRRQSNANRQGSEGVLDLTEGAALTKQESELHGFVRGVYETRLAKGVSREQARKDLPLSTYTEAYWKIDLHNLLHFLALRMALNAQHEIRQYATVIGEEIVSKWVPSIWRAFLDYRVNSLVLSVIEARFLTEWLSHGPEGGERVLEESGLLEWDDAGELKPNRERRELKQKLERLGLQIPWN